MEAEPRRNHAAEGQRRLHEGAESSLRDAARPVPKVRHKFFRHRRTLEYASNRHSIARTGLPDQYRSLIRKSGRAGGEPEHAANLLLDWGFTTNPGIQHRNLAGGDGRPANPGRPATGIGGSRARRPPAVAASRRRPRDRASGPPRSRSTSDSASGTPRPTPAPEPTTQPRRMRPRRGRSSPGPPPRDVAHARPRTPAECDVSRMHKTDINSITDFRVKFGSRFARRISIILRYRLVTPLSAICPRHRVCAEPAHRVKSRRPAVSRSGKVGDSVVISLPACLPCSPIHLSGEPCRRYAESRRRQRVSRSKNPTGAGEPGESPWPGSFR